MKHVLKPANVMLLLTGSMLIVLCWFWHSAGENDGFSRGWNAGYRENEWAANAARDEVCTSLNPGAGQLVWLPEIRKCGTWMERERRNTLKAVEDYNLHRGQGQEPILVQP